MKQQKLKVQSVEKVTHDVLRIRLEKPSNFSFKPGQAVDIAINKQGWETEFRPFTFTCLPEDNFLEFTIKIYPQDKGVTNELLNLKVNDELIAGEPFGTIAYKGDGLFVAGGAGITPFISIFRLLHKRNEIGSSKLIFANKTSADIINKDEFRNILGENFINILSDEKTDVYAYGLISRDFIKQHLDDVNKYVYICGPDPMMEVIVDYLHQLGVKDEFIVKEEF